MRIISGKASRLPLKTPKSELRPTMEKVRAAVFSTLLQGLHFEPKGARVLDLFAGSGAYGLEALSRGALHVDFVDQDREAVDCIRRNITFTKLETGAHVHQQDALSWIQRWANRGPGYDLVLADPPYERPDYNNPNPPPDMMARLLLGTPWAEVLSTHGILVLEQSLERPIDKCPALEILRYRRYGKTLVIYYALPGAYVVKGDGEGEDA